MMKKTRTHPSSAPPPQLTNGIDHVSAATRLLEKRKEMLEIQSTLESKRDEFRDRMSHTKKKESDLSVKRDEMTENLIKLEKFIRVSTHQRAMLSSVQETASKKQQKLLTLLIYKTTTKNKPHAG